MWVAVGLVVLLVVALMAVLFAGAGGGRDGDPPSTGPVDASAVYAQHCANCHGIDGQGGIGPPFAGGRMADVYPDIEDQIDVIREGRNQMPPFDGVLTEDEMRAVAEHERAL